MSDLVSVKTDGVAVIIIATVYFVPTAQMWFLEQILLIVLVYVNDYGQL